MRPVGSCEAERSTNAMVTSDFRLGVEIWPFCACALKKMHYNPYLWTNHRNSLIIQEIWAKEVDSNVRFKTEVEIWPFCTCAMKNIKTLII